MTDKLSDTDAKRLDFLLADLGKAKDEIARRSGLQERALALYFSVIAFAVLHSDTGRLLCASVAWVAAWLTLVFYFREHSEVTRLAAVIRSRIAVPASQILGTNANCLVPSEHPEDVAVTDATARKLNVHFFVISFGVIPSVLTCMAFWPPTYFWKLFSISEPVIFLTLATVVGAFVVIRLLRRTFRGPKAPTPKPSRFGR